jgi:N-acetylmuramoyl-L-alanine amidase
MGTPALAAAAVERIDVDRDKVVVLFSEPVAEASAFVVDAPRRIAVDVIGVDPNSVSDSGGSVAGVRQGRTADGARIDRGPRRPVRRGRARVDAAASHRRR